MSIREFLFGMVISWGIIFNALMYIGEPHFSLLGGVNQDIVVIYPYWFSEFLFGYLIFLVCLWFAIEMLCRVKIKKEENVE